MGGEEEEEEEEDSLCSISRWRASLSRARATRSCLIAALRGSPRPRVPRCVRLFFLPSSLWSCIQSARLADDMIVEERTGTDAERLVYQKASTEGI